MLVLSRRVNEKIVMPTLGATVQLVAAKQGVARLGVEAPDNVPVFREEVLERLGADERAALAPEPVERLREQVRVLSEALGAATAGLALVRRQLANWQTEELAAALDRLAWDLKAAQHKAAGAEPVSLAVTPVLADLIAQ